MALPRDDEIGMGVCVAFGFMSFSLRFMSQSGLCHLGLCPSASGLCHSRVYVLQPQVYVTVGFMSFGLMSLSTLCCSRPYVVWVNVAVGYMSFGLMLFCLMSPSGMCLSGQCHSA